MYRRREDADYSIRKKHKDNANWIFEDKRVGHKILFTDVQPNGFQNNIFLRKLSPMERQNDENATTGNRVAILNKTELPRWIITEFESIHNKDDLTPQTDPRDVGDR
jgi:hypothetical protein